MSSAMPSKPNSQAKTPEEGDEKPNEKNYDGVIGRKIDGWEVVKVLGQRANGVCFKVKKDNVVGALKLHFRNVQEMIWESLIYDRLADAKNIESRNGNIVRKYAQGTTSFPEEDLENVAYVVMELGRSTFFFVLVFVLALPFLVPEPFVVVLPCPLFAASVYY